MFRPIKNLITYIQKNAGSGAIFGTTTPTTTTTTEITPTAEKAADEMASTRVDAEAEAQQVLNDAAASSHGGDGGDDEINDKAKCTDVKDGDFTTAAASTKDANAAAAAAAQPSTETATEDENNLGSSEFYEDAVDIEMQIKSSVMFKKSSIVSDNDSGSAIDGDAHVAVKSLNEASIADEAAAASTVAASTIAPAATATDKKSTNNNNNNSSYELVCGVYGLAQSIDATCAQNVEDCCSVGSADVATGGEDTAEELNTEDEETTEERYLDYAQDIATFPSSEIIVLNDVDLNSSVASDAPSEDPLAIDEFTQASATTCSQISLGLATPTCAETSFNHTNDSAMSGNEDGSSLNSDMLWINVDTMKSSNSEKDLTDDTPLLHIGMPQKRPALNTMNTMAALESAGGERGHMLPKSVSEENAEEFRSDGSDSGLGSETSTLQTTLASITDTSQMSCSAAGTPTQVAKQERMTTSLDALCDGISTPSETVATAAVAAAANNQSNVVETSIAARKAIQQPLRSNLKRRLDDDDDAIIATATSPSTSSATAMGLMQKKPKRSINFDAVRVFYFPRQQGFGCVPSAGGCTLGMAATHVSTKTLSLAEHAAELRRAHRLQLQEINPRGSSSDDSEESEDDYLSDGSGSDLDAESNGFLQPVSPKQRRALLKAAGVRKIDASEKMECRDIRNSREVCGCSCREFCDPETCACNLAGIKCQVDRAMFPCGCSRDACGNTVGRVEFNPQRVRIHYIHTLMRLEMENRQQQNPTHGLGGGADGSGSILLSYGLAQQQQHQLDSSMVASGVVNAANSSSGSVAAMQTNLTQLPGNFYGLQTQSNYSSGYASPVYATETTGGVTAAAVAAAAAANYYQPQSGLHQFGDGMPALAEIESIHTPPAQYPMVDALSSNLFVVAAAANAVGSGATTPAYADLMPSYGNMGTITAANTNASVYHQQTLSDYTNNNVSSTYTSYQQQHQMCDEQIIRSTPPSTTATATYSSCAVPSAPPFGSATTITTGAAAAAAMLYDKECTVILESTNAASCILVDTMDDDAIIGHDEIMNSSSRLQTDEDVDVRSDGDVGDIGSTNGASINSSFIDLNTPIANATRLSQINDLLQHNRNTTAALVAITPSANCTMLMNACTTPSPPPPQPPPSVAPSAAPSLTRLEDKNDSSDLSLATRCDDAMMDAPVMVESTKKCCVTTAIDELSSNLDTLNGNDNDENKNDDDAPNADATKTPSFATVGCDDSKYATVITNADKTTAVIAAEQKDTPIIATTLKTTTTTTTTTSATLELEASN